MQGGDGVLPRGVALPRPAECLGLVEGTRWTSQPRAQIGVLSAKAQEVAAQGGGQLGAAGLSNPTGASIGVRLLVPRSPSPSSSVGDLRDFVRSHLGNPALPFHLCEYCSRPACASPLGHGPLLPAAGAVWMGR